MKKVLIICGGADSSHFILNRESVDFLSQQGSLDVNVTTLMLDPRDLNLYNAVIFIGRRNFNKANALKFLYPAKVVIVLCETVQWEDEDGSVIPFCSTDDQLLQKLLDCILENGTENLEKGYLFTFAGGQDCSGGYGVVVGDAQAMLFEQVGRKWNADYGPIPHNAVKLKSDFVPVEVDLGLRVAKRML